MAGCHLASNVARGISAIVQYVARFHSSEEHDHRDALEARLESHQENASKVA